MPIKTHASCATKGGKNMAFCAMDLETIEMYRIFAKHLHFCRVLVVAWPEFAGVVTVQWDMVKYVWM